MRQKLFALFAAMVAALCPLPNVSAAGGTETKGFACKDVPEPVVDISFGSRYTEDSKTRSEIDEASNEEVDKALAPVEKFISELSKMANAAYLEEKDRERRVACVTEWLSAWADADALTEPGTLNAKLAAPARYAGFAIALLQADVVGDVPAAEREKIVAWLTTLGRGTMDFFDNDAPPKASRNNLRAWAGLAVAAIGLAANDKSMIDWAETTFELVACSADPDGSLPLEMGRADRALNYQLHAVAPLVVTAELLAGSGFDGYSLCGGKLKQIAEFSFAAIQDPGLVEAINGKVQTFATGEQKVEPYMMAWVEPYLARVANPELAEYVAELRPLSHSKLGGNLTKMQGWTAKLDLPASS